jgi:hypothetical protein
MQAMARDLEQTVRDLQKTAIGNCAKRIEEAAHKSRKKPGSDPDATSPCGEKPLHGVTACLRDKYGL